LKWKAKLETESPTPRQRGSAQNIHIQFVPFVVKFLAREQVQY
jgi:hypothetical protein